MTKLLAIRFSALGDVAMTVPVIYALALRYPQLDITVLSRPMCQPLFANLPSNVHFFSVELSGRHKGICGLNKLLHDIDYKTFDYVADLHDVLRTKYLRKYFWIKGKKIAAIQKGRTDKQALVRKRKKHLSQLDTSFERYASVFAKIGFAVDLKQVPKYKIINATTIDFVKEENIRWIGIAPFAKHQGKIYPLDKMEQVVCSLAQKENTTVFLFGAGKQEMEILENWAQKYAHAISVAGKYALDGELKLMEQLDVMLSMDSANMHLASLVDVPVVSVWGATHSYVGFLGWNQNPENIVQIEMDCRPCSVFGDQPCYRGDYACLNRITPKMIVDKIESALK